MFPGVLVSKKSAEEVRKLLKNKDVLDPNKVPLHEDNYVIFPIKEEKVAEARSLGLRIVYRDFKVKRKIKSYKDLVQIPENLKKYLPTSFDQIGDIVIIKIPEEVLDYASQIGEAIIKAYKSVKSVYLDKGVKGPYRVRDLEHIAGERKTETIYKEYGTRFIVDVSKVYVSPRLAEEHKKFSEYVKPSEIVFDMFSGFGPFSIFAAKKGASAVATDINPYAIHYLYESAKLNRVEDKILGLVSDCRKVARLIKVNHVVMNYPHGSISFLDYALESIKTPGYIHIYVIEYNDKITQTADNIVHLIENKGYKAKLVEISCGKPYAPYQAYYGVHIRIVGD